MRDRTVRYLEGAVEGYVPGEPQAEAGLGVSLSDAPPPGLRRHRPPLRQHYPATLADLLRPESRAFPLTGREAELAALQAWLRGSGPGALAITGPEGSGKTRLAFELAAWAEDHGWSVVFAPDAAVSSHSTTAGPRLVVRDITDTGIEMRVPAPGPDTRVLLLSRSGEPIGGHSERQSIALPGLRSTADRTALLNRAIAVGASCFRGPARTARPAHVLDSGDPLHLIMAGLLSPLTGLEAALALPVSALAAQFAALEAERLDRAAIRAWLDPALVRHAALCVTLHGGCGATRAEAIIAEEALAFGFHLPHGPASVADVLADLLTEADDGWFQPIGPEPVGAAFVERELSRFEAGSRAAILARAAARRTDAPT